MRMDKLEERLREHKVYRMVAMCVGRTWVLTAHVLGRDNVAIEGVSLGEALSSLVKRLEQS